jgi:hypothetical protein
MSLRCFGVLAALLALLIGAPVSRPVDAPPGAVARAAAAQDAVSAESSPHQERSQASVCQRIDGDDTPDPPVHAAAVVDRPEAGAHRAAKPPADPACPPAARAAPARGPPTV